MTTPDKGWGHPWRNSYRRVERCQRVRYDQFGHGVSIERCKTFIPEGRGECMECRTPDSSPFSYPEATK